jgi:hypothetical protein
VIEYANHHQPGGLGATVIGGHVYRGQALSRKTGLWHMEQLRIATSPTGRVGHYVLGFGHDLAGEMYLLTTD